MTIGILGTGYQVPQQIRRNTDPIFGQITRTPNTQGVAEADLFTGFEERRVLGAGETVETLMTKAACQALAHAQISPEQIDRLYGYASVSPFLTPNALYGVHRRVGLAPHAMVVPINSEFSNFVVGLIHAWEAIQAGHATYALVVCGSNWTRHLDYTQGHALGVGDGAGAVVVGPRGRFGLLDYAVETRSEQYGAMIMQVRPVTINGYRYLPIDEHNLPRPTYTITPQAGLHSFQTAGMDGPPELVQRLLAKHGLTGSDIALITHQASRVMLDHWAECIQPKEHGETLEQFGNLTVATLAVNLAWFFERFTADYLVLVGLGVGFHQAALLLKRVM